MEMLFEPFVYDGELVLEVECGANIAWMFLSRLCQGSKGASILFQNVWVTPNEFQFLSGRETAKDWKRSIRHKGRSLKLLMAKGAFDCKRQSLPPAAEDGVSPLLEEKMDGDKQCNAEPKKGKQLTSIIDQLRINKSKDAAQPEATPKSFSGQQDSDTSTAGGSMPTDAAAPPDESPESSPSVSPPPFFRAPFSPPIKQMELMTRNYSDFMRCLAAKYNNNDTTTSFPQQSNGGGLVRSSYDTAAPFPAGSSSPFVARSSDSDSGGSLPPSRPPADFSSSQTLLNLVRTASAQSASQLETYLTVKRAAAADPLDLTVGGAVKKARGANERPAWMSLLDRRLVHGSSPPKAPPRCASLCIDKSCSPQSEANDLARWTVDDVVNFVAGVDTCSEYVEKFRAESIDGTTLPLLTEDHLTSHLGMKLGPALKLRSTLARRIGHCAVCMHCVHCHATPLDQDPLSSSSSPLLTK